MVIEDVLFENFSGTSGAYAPIVGTLVCSSPSVSLARADKPVFTLLMSVQYPALLKHSSEEYQHHEYKWGGG